MYLVYHEYLEFISRVALQLFPNERSIDYSVFNLLEILYQKEGIKGKNEAKNINPDIDISL